MTWWCSALERPWDWTPRPYFGVWLLCAALGAGYWWAVRSHRDHSGQAIDSRKAWQFFAGVLGLWVASDWPVGALGGAYLSSVHMLQYMLYTLLAAPMLMLGTPQWMAQAALRSLRLDHAWHLLTRPLIAAIVTNVLLLATHAPISVDLLRATQLGSFVLDMLWLISGLVLWGPIISPIRHERTSSPLVKIVYLFAAAALMPMIPGGFLAFASNPLYSTYELAPRVGLTALADQQLAGVLMKVGNVPVIWAVMGVIWFRWYESDRASSAQRRRDRPATRIEAGSH